MRIALQIITLLTPTLMDPPMDTSSFWKRLSMREIVATLPHSTFSSKERRSRALLDDAVTRLPADQRAMLNCAAISKFCDANLCDDTRNTTNVLRPTIINDSEDCFFETVSEDCRRDRITRFIDATGNKATAVAACAVCAGSFFVQELYELRVSDLKTKNALAPSTPHAAQKLTDGMLLHMTPSSNRTGPNGDVFVNVCNSCMSDLKRNKTPKLSLANGMWIGDIPLELKVLTLPERILVARYFPAVYIVKLYPKKKGARNWCSPSGLHSALRGNVSTYRLNTEQIAHLASSHIMPPSSAILAATIGVTFVGPRNIPQRTLPGFLRVNRTRVRVALEWLKENNPLYANINISPERLDALPIDGIPEEILSVAKFSDDTKLLEEERNGYVPADDPELDTDERGKLTSHVDLIRKTQALLESDSDMEDWVEDDDELMYDANDLEGIDGIVVRHRRKTYFFQRPMLSHCNR